MAFREANLLKQLDELDAKLAELRSATSGAPLSAIERFRLDASAARFHLRNGNHRPLLVAIVGGTGTGKSTLVNRLVGADVTATSFRRTFTAGAVAVADAAGAIPANWLRLDAIAPKDLPARGEPESLVIVTHVSPLTARVTLV